MAKVVTERPRAGGGSGIKRGGRVRCTCADPEDCDHGPTFYSSARHRHPGGGKNLTDLLSPLWGWLRTQVNRPWDKVWSEAKANLDDRSMAGSHIIDHLLQEVERHCYLTVEGKVYVHGRYGGDPYPVSGYYVHPRTGLLRFSTDRRFPRYRPDPRKRALHRFGVDEVDRYRADGNRLWEKTEHGWFIHTYGELDPNAIVSYRAVPGTGQPVGKSYYLRVNQIMEPVRRGPGVWGRLSSKQASKRELRELPE